MHKFCSNLAKITDPLWIILYSKHRCKLVLKHKKERDFSRSFLCFSIRLAYAACDCIISCASIAI